tara:strand:+ start:426 stop:977 length:552 start_codon:yes stop_codon:yes gene_type:complete
MKIKKLSLPGPYLIEPKIFFDKRGSLYESWNESNFSKKKIITKISQVTVTRSKKNVLRGLHFQYPNLQGKLISVMNGKIFDVIVDIRKNSPNFGKWCSVILDSKKKKILWIPKGFGHGYLVLSTYADVIYKCDCKYYPKNQREIIWNDQFIKINWPIKNPILSKKDAAGLKLNEIKKLPKWKK